jgi:non-ribosomal peptide synthetase component F
MTVLAVIKVLLHRYSNQQDICVGTVVAGRQQRELDELVGFFVNTLALRNEVSSDDSFHGLLEKVKVTTLEAFANQDLPFEKVVEAVSRNSDLSRTPLFQVMLSWQNTPNVPAIHLGEVTLSAETFVHNTAKFDLTFNITESTGGFKGCYRILHRSLCGTRIEMMLVHF